MPMSSRFTRGFTLVELLIVVSLVSILVGALFSIINPRGIQAKARDSQRASDLAKVKVALESYFSDKRRYPLAEKEWVLVSEDTLELSDLTPNYINNLPSDPKDGGVPCTEEAWRRYIYRSFEGGSRYLLATSMELPSDGSYCPAGFVCDCMYASGGVAYYTTVD